MSIYQFENYREAIKYLADTRKAADQSFSYGKLADAVGIQRSYFSNVLKDRSDFNADQLYKIAEEMGLDLNAIDFLLNLLEYERCQVPSRKKILKEKLEKFRFDMMNSIDILDFKKLEVDADFLVEYSTTPALSLVHLYLTIEKYQKDVSLIAPKLHVKEEQVENCIKKLMKHGIINLTKKGYRATEESFQIGNKAHLNQAHAATFRLKALQHFQTNIDEQDQFFTTSFSAGENVMIKIKDYWLEFLHKVETVVVESPSEEVYQLNFDCFKY